MNIPIPAHQSAPLPVNYTAVYPYPAQLGPLGGSWHSGCSPHKYELVELPPNVKKCYGCGSEFAEKYKCSPNNVIVRHCDRRLMRRDERTGLFQYSPDYTNTYYHLDFSHIQRKNPLFNGKVYLQFEKYQTFDPRQRDVINQCNLEVNFLH